MSEAEQEQPDVVARMNAITESTVTDEMIEQFIKEAFETDVDVSRMASVQCPECHKSFRTRVDVTVANFAARAKAIEVLLNRTKGKPKETKVVEAKIQVGTREELEAMSIEELYALADS